MKKSLAALALFAMLTIISIDTSSASEDTCTIYCPNSGIDCTVKKPDGTMIWSEKGPNDPASVEGPCDVILD